jgi:acetyltransferase-like isoleucine patch superfamily enzyme
MQSKIMRRLRWLKLKSTAASVAYDIQLNSDVFSGNVQNLYCGRSAWFAAGSRVIMGAHQNQPGKLSIGDNFFINHYSIIDCHYEITIGDRVMIGPQCYIGDFDHDIQMLSDSRIRHEGKALPIRIEDDVWIGAGVIILKGVTIESGAVVGAGSVVTKNVARNTIVVGNPARPLRSRELDAAALS